MPKFSKFALIASLFAALSLPFFTAAEEEMPAEEAIMAVDEAHDVAHDGAVIDETMIEDAADTVENPVLDQDMVPQDEPMPEEFDEVPME